MLPDFEGGVKGEKWSVVACDQFTSEPEYWNKARQIAGEAPSALNVTLPEIYLSDGSDVKEKINKINATMRVYEDTVLKTHKDSMIYVERIQSNGKLRCGIVGKVDLECYDYAKTSNSLIRATEGTVTERIPPRVNIRRDATIELPHVMLLIDDRNNDVIGPLAKKKNKMKTAYDFDLMLGGGHITGKFIDKDEQERINKALETLCSDDSMKEKYGKEGLSPLLFAVGDGNHSLAAAKAAYNEVKEKFGEEYAKNSPARYALAEIVNLHDTGLEFEPIYRVMFSVDVKDVLESLKKYALASNGDADSQIIKYISETENGEITIEKPSNQLAVGSLQSFIDEYLKTHPNAKVDYIHGENSLCTLAKKKDAVGFLFNGMQKNELFKTVIFDGALPRKTFSMGHAEDKRYYLECRKIK